jgi:phosphoserine aminotransferase
MVLLFHRASQTAAAVADVIKSARRVFALPNPFRLIFLFYSSTLNSRSPCR